MIVDSVLLAEVTNLINNEAKFLDRRDWEKWLELYTEDAVFWAPSWSDEENIIEILQQGALKANQAMESTKEMLSKKGRIS